MVKVKICGITNLEDALAAVICGCDALGFVFYRESTRYITPSRAAGIIGLLPKKVLKVGVFVDAPAARIKDIANRCGLDMLQFHGRETPAFCKKFKNWRVIKAFRVKDRISQREVLRYDTFAYLFDAYSKSAAGGTGRTFDWRLLGELRSLKRPIFLSGGISSGNVRRAIRIARPEWIDASSLLEAGPGRKDHRKVCGLIRIVKS
ncbi:MAG: phosphoribosylanthranilate isomerase [Candidatus Omnitrophota bacterium]|jgi:phosphoribosylanthranilate isomerase